MDSRYWGSKILQESFVKYLAQAKLRSPFEPLYWMLISKGYKTYLLARNNVAKCYPNAETHTPIRYQRLMDGFYRHKFGNAYDAARNHIAYESCHGAVKGEIAVPTPSDLRNGDIRFFVDHNPRYREGVELACLAEVRLSDLTIQFRKRFMRAKPAPSQIPAAALQFAKSPGRFRIRGAGPGKASSASSA
jgi:hypothetical protein